MDNKSIVRLRLVNQQIAESKFESAQELLEWLGAMQAQDFNMAKWGLGARIPGSRNIEIEEEFNKGKILRTHLMRPTWHMVSSKDIYWMLQLTAPQIKSGTKTRQRELGFTSQLINKSLDIIERALDLNGPMTRDELMKELSYAKIQTDNNRSSHILVCAEMERLICSGPLKNDKLTYALLDKRLETKISLFPDEALATLAGKYFRSHGPATMDDFIWWSGLKTADARKGFEIIKEKLLSEKVGDQVYWFTPSKKTVAAKDKNRAFLLPAFDEYIISYRHRHASIVFEESRKVISSNGIFRPIIVINGQVSGVWRRELKKDKVLIEIDLFVDFSEDIVLRVKEQVEHYARFLGVKPDVQFKKQKPLR